MNPPVLIFLTLFIALHVCADQDVQLVQQIQEERDNATKVIEDCALKSSANLTAILNPDYAGDDPNFNCFFKCTFVALGFVDENGNTNFTKYTESFELKEGGEEKIKTCINGWEENVCDRIYLSQVCVLNNINLGELNEETI